MDLILSNFWPKSMFFEIGSNEFVSWFFDPKFINAKKCKIAYFLRNHIFRFLIISLVIFVLQECTIPQIKAKDISFGPYSFSFLAKINILWERKRQSCLVFFYPDLRQFTRWIWWYCNLVKILWKLKFWKCLVLKKYSRFPNKRGAMLINLGKFSQSLHPYFEGVRLSILTK